MVINIKSMLGIILLGVIFIFFASSAHTKEYLTKQKALELAFPDADSVSQQTILLSNEQREKINKLTQQKIIMSKFDYHTGTLKGVMQGHAVFGEAYSKSDIFSYILVLNLDCSICMVEILTYNGIRGHEVRQKGFLNQFKGKTLQDNLQLRSDIKNMAGATISCQSLTDSIRQNMVYVSVLLIPKATSRIKRNEVLSIVPNPVIITANQRCYQRTQYLMGTLLEITIYAADDIFADKVITSAFDEVARLEYIFSIYRQESDVSRLNHAALGIPISVSNEFITLLTRCRLITERTHGAFDVTVGPLVNLWKDAEKRGVLPSETAINLTMKSVGIQNLVIDNGQNTVTRLHEGVKLDFGGIAKGYAIDCVADIIKKAGVTAALINFGGQYLAVGPPEDQPFWRIYVRHPKKFQDPVSSIAEINLITGSISTTGDYERGLIIDRQRYSHIIDPRFGKPVQNMSSVTIVADNATDADALSTGLYVLGLVDGQCYADQYGIAALMMKETDEIVKTAAFSKVIK
jgi:thiamine biosynthesis lipoprotein